MTAPTVTSKRCSRCGDTKPLDEFARDKRRPDGRQSRCRPCNAQAIRESRKRHGYDREKSRRRAESRAAAEFRERFPRRWEQILADCEAELGITRDLWERS